MILLPWVNDELNVIYNFLFDISFQLFMQIMRRLDDRYNFSRTTLIKVRHIFHKHEIICFNLYQLSEVLPAFGDQLCTSHVTGLQSSLYK